MRRDNNNPSACRAPVAELLAVSTPSPAYEVTKHLTLRLNVNNLFGHRTYVQAANNNGARFNPGAPRAYLLTADLKF